MKRLLLGLTLIALASSVLLLSDWNRRIMRGESPARIPIQSFTKTKLMINAPAARSVGLNIPQSVMKRNPEVIGN